MCTHSVLSLVFFHPCSLLYASRSICVSVRRYSGHNKWSKIKRKKAVADTQRAAAGAKILTAISQCARVGGTDPDNNMQLAHAISRAKQAEIPKASIEKAIKNAGPQSSELRTDEILYEGRSASQFHMLVEVLTDNRNRTRPQIRKILKTHGYVYNRQYADSRKN